MKSLDEILTDSLPEDLTQTFYSALDLSQWTKENRDEKILEIANVFQDYSKITAEFIEDLLKPTATGPSMLELKLKYQFILGELEFLGTLRSQLDTAADLSEFPIDYDWVNEKIRQKYQELKDLENTLQVVSPEDNTEEL
jgi:hypothetical protein